MKQRLFTGKTPKLAITRGSIPAPRFGVFGFVARSISP